MPLKIGKRKDRPGAGYWITGTVHGVRIRRGSGTSDRRAAEEIANEIERRIIREAIHGPESVITFAQACAQYADAGGETRFLPRVMQHVPPETLLRDITPVMVRDTARAIYPDAAPSTRNRQVIAPVSAVINHAHQHGLCGPVRIEKFKVQDKPRPFANIDWIVSFREACRLPHLSAAVSFMFVTGARIGSAIKLEAGDVTLGDCSAILRKTKNGKDHAVVFPSWLAEEIAALPAHCLTDRQQEDGLRPRVFHYTAPNSLRGMMYQVCDRAGLKRLTPHEAGRHAYGAIAREVMQGDDGKAAKAGGWDSVELYRRRYAHTTDERREIAAQIGRMIDTGLTPSDNKDDSESDNNDIQSA